MIFKVYKKFLVCQDSSQNQTKNPTVVFRIKAVKNALYNNPTSASRRTAGLAVAAIETDISLE